MTENDLAEKLREMREEGGPGNLDVMTRLFGVIFAREIGEVGVKNIAAAYNDKGYAGRVNEAVVQDGRKLAQFVMPRAEQRWRAEASRVTDDRGS